MKMLPKILMVDDDDDDKLLMKSAFEDNNYEADFDFANNGEELMIKLNQFKTNLTPNPSLIILDLNMPKISGHDVLKFLKNDTYYNTIPIIIFSTSRSETDISYAMNLGASDYIIKPSSYAQLLEVVKKINLFCLDFLSGSNFRTI